jgi:hypothetical protein
MVLCLVVSLALSFVVLVPAPALAYIGPGPGLDLIPNFFALLLWAGFAFGAVLLWPVSTFLRWLRRTPGERAGDPQENTRSHSDLRI